MSRIDRMFEIIQLLRRAGAPMTAETIANLLEVNKRTIYRDIASLQAMRVPIEGEAGIGYVMRRGFDLPPLMFNDEEIEAIVVGLALVRRTGDAGLRKAARRAANKIADALPGGRGDDVEDPALYVSGWNAVPTAPVDPGVLRACIRDEEKIRLVYRDQDGEKTRRTVWPLALIYYVEAQVLAAWCEKRRDFRHFRIDRMVSCKPRGARFAGDGDRLRSLWQERQTLP